MARGPQASITCSGTVVLNAGDNIQAAITANPNGTSFCLQPGIYDITGVVTPKTGNTFTGNGLGVVLDGSAWLTSSADHAPFYAHNVDVDNVTIRNLTIRNMPQKGIHGFGAAASSWIVEYCEITGTRTAVSVPSGSIVRHCVLHHNSRGAYSIFLGHDITFDDCEVSYNGTEQKLVGVVNGTFTNSFVHHNAGDGIWFDTDNTGSVIWGNIADDNGRYGIHYEISGSGVIHDNDVNRNLDCGIFISTSKDVEIYDNQLAGNFRGIMLLIKCSVVGGGTMPGGYDLMNVDVHDNTVVAGTRSGTWLNSLNSDGCTSLTLAPYLNGSKNLTFTDNVYQAPNLETAWWRWGGPYVAKTWAEWQALGNDTGGSFTVGSVVVPPEDPAAIDPGSGEPGSGTGTISTDCCEKQPPTGDTGKAPDPVGDAPAFLLTCIGAGQPDTNMSIANGELL